MVGNWVLDNLEKLLLRIRGSDGESVEQLNHQTCETLECTRDSDSGADFDQDAFSGCDVDLELAGLVDGGVEKGEKTLKCECAF
jgi:hypothetical protein